MFQYEDLPGIMYFGAPSKHIELKKQSFFNSSYWDSFFIYY